MIQPKEISINGRTFIISKFNYEDGREIITQYPVSAVPKLGDYARNKELVRLMMTYVSVPISGSAPVALVTPELINNHLGDWETGMKLEAALLEYNCSFFQDGRASTFLDDIAQNLPAWISSMLTPLLERLLHRDTPL
jgi:hypothetical protein